MSMMAPLPARDCSEEQDMFRRPASFAIRLRKPAILVFASSGARSERLWLWVSAGCMTAVPWVLLWKFETARQEGPIGLSAVLVIGYGELATSVSLLDRLLPF